MDGAAEAIVTGTAGRFLDPSRARVRSPSLAGAAAVALLYAELARTDGRYWPAAHDYLMRAAAAAATAPLRGLYTGPVAVAFAASCAARPGADYAGLLDKLDRRTTAGVAARLQAEWQRIEARRAGTSFDAYDVPTGAAGVGRYLLSRGPDTRPALSAILSYLTALSRPLPAVPLPGWWVAHSPYVEAAPPGGDGAHANLGLAHGVSGPLALLALAWQAGVRVPGQDEAMVRMVEWLLWWHDTDAAGPYWPATLLREELADRPVPLPPTNPAWCYGVPGVARALQLAGLALDQPEWTAMAVRAVGAMLDRLAGGGAVTGTGLCHGWAGLLHVTRLIGLDSGDPRVAGAAAGMAAEVVQRLAPVPGASRPDHEPADLLQGEVGVALALHSQLAGERPASGWDAALLVG